MPSTYAHYCFGKAVYRRLPQEIQEEIKAYSPLYMTGLHGPDILFYYKPLKSNAINRIGYGMHGRPADEFFKKAWMRARELPEGRGGFAYLYGFICHFALDHSCHPYIEKKIKENPEWVLAGIYADEGKSGTSYIHRAEFNRMMEDCRQGKIQPIRVITINTGKHGRLRRLLKA